MDKNDLYCLALSFISFSPLAFSLKIKKHPDSYRDAKYVD